MNQEQSEITTLNSGHERYTELDSLRGLASVTVFFSHFVLGSVITAPFFLSLNFTPLHLLWDGASAVSFFFILSGFVLALPYVNNERPIALLSYYVKRVFRIYPAFIVAIAISMLLKTWVYNGNGLTHFSPWLMRIWQWDNRENIAQIIKTFTLIGNFTPGLIDAVIWSLAIEMNISLLIPFLVSIIRKHELIFSLLFMAVLLYVGINFYVCFFYAGVLLAKYRQPIGVFISSASAAVRFSLFVAAIVLYSSSFTFHLNPDRHFHDYLSAAGSCLFIVLALYNPGFSSFLKNKVCQFLGKISYSFYLLHLPVFITVASVFPFSGSSTIFAVMGVSLIATCFLSYITYRLVELPFQKAGSAIAKRIKSLNSIQF